METRDHKELMHKYLTEGCFVFNEVIPTIVRENGNQEWWKRGRRHRVSGPAIIADTYFAWYFDGRYHRVDGPAIEWKDGRKAFYTYGRELTEQQFLQRKINDLLK